MVLTLRVVHRAVEAMRLNARSVGRVWDGGAVSTSCRWHGTNGGDHNGEDKHGQKDTLPDDKKGAEADDDVEDDGMVEMWNKDAPAGPEWNGPRGYEPTRYKDWSNKGRVSDF